VGELEVALEVRVAREGVDGAAWHVAGVAALTFTTVQLGNHSFYVGLDGKGRRTL